VTHALSRASLRRLPQYIKVLVRLVEEEQPYVTSAEFAQLLELDETLVRKDLAVTGFTGKPRVGFAARGLLDHLESFLGLRTFKEAFLIGAGRLGQALSQYRGFVKYGLHIAGVFDNDPLKIGQTVGDLEIQPVWKAPVLARRQEIRIALLTVPPQVAQSVADLLVDAGVIAFWNFSGQPLRMPSPVIVHDEDLADSLAVLSHRLVQYDLCTEAPVAFTEMARAPECLEGGEQRASN